MLKNLNPVKIFYKLFNFLFMKISPLLYAKYLGVNFKGKVHLYGNISWGTEPWLIKIGNNVHITKNVTFVNHDGGTLILRYINPSLEITKPITIKDNVYIGINSILMPGIVIENNVIVGAGSIVTKNLESGYVYAGNPAKKIKTIDEYFDKITKESLAIGHLKGREKEKQLKIIYKDFLTVK